MTITETPVIVEEPLILPYHIDDPIEDLFACETADDVVAFLRAHKIKGIRGNGHLCPVANFLTLQSDDRASVGGCAAAWKTAGIGHRLRELTPALQTFVYRFDSNAYPDLEAW